MARVEVRRLSVVEEHRDDDAKKREIVGIAGDRGARRGRLRRESSVDGCWLHAPAQLADPLRGLGPGQPGEGREAGLGWLPGTAGVASAAERPATQRGDHREGGPEHCLGYGGPQRFPGGCERRHERYGHREADRQGEPSRREPPEPLVEPSRLVRHHSLRCYAASRTWAVTDPSPLGVRDKGLGIRRRALPPWGRVLVVFHVEPV